MCRKLTDAVLISQACSQAVQALISCVVTTVWLVGLAFLIFISRLIWHQTQGKHQVILQQSSQKDPCVRKRRGEERQWVGGRVCEGSARGGLTGMLWRSRMLPRRMQETTQQKSSKGMQQHQP